MNLSSEDRSLIEDVVYAYAAGIDGKDRTLFEDVFTEQCVVSMGDFAGPFEGREQFTSFIMHFHAPLDASQHSVTNVRVIELDGDTARVQSAIDALLVNIDHPYGSTFRIVGFYCDQMVRDGSAWKICQRELVPVWTEGNPNVGAWDWEPPRAHT